MTRKEAIKRLNDWIEIGFYFDDGYGVEELSEEEKETCNMAIKALEQQPCEDCVSKQAVLDIVRFEDKWLFDAQSNNADTAIAFNAIISNVQALPSVTPTRKKGKWIKLYFGSMYDICSECGQKVTTGYFEYNYCPSCGAEMGSEE